MRKVSIDEIFFWSIFRAFGRTISHCDKNFDRWKIFELSAFIGLRIIRFSSLSVSCILSVVPLFRFYYFRFDLLLSPLTILQEFIFGDEWYSHTSKLILKFTPIYENLAPFLSQKQEFNKNCVQLASAYKLAKMDHFWLFKKLQLN